MEEMTKHEIELTKRVNYLEYKLEIVYQTLTDHLSNDKLMDKLNSPMITNKY